MLFRNDGVDESGSCSEDELYIFSDDNGANDILVSYSENDNDSSSDKGDANSNDGPFETGTLTHRNHPMAMKLSLIHFTAAQGCTSLRSIKPEKK